MPERAHAPSVDKKGGRHLEPVELAVEAAPGGLALGPRPPSHALAAVGSAAARAFRGTEPKMADVPQPAGGSRRGIGAGIREAGPLALAGFAANGANVVVTLLVARLLSTRGYGALAQLTSVFLVVSMPGTAVVVGVVRRVTALSIFGSTRSVASWARRNHARATGVLLVLCVAVMAARGPLAHLLSIPAPLGVFAATAAGAVWVLLSLDRGLLQACQSYRTLAVNLLVEGGVRTVAVLCFVAAGLGVAGAAWGLLLAELVTALHARIAADRTWHVGSLHAHGAARAHLASNARESSPVPLFARKRLLLDMGSALVAMALLAYLQNADVIVLSREAPHSSGPYAAISVASKALVFGAIALGGYLLPEAAIEWHRGGHALRQLLVTLLVLAVPGTVLVVAAAAFPKALLSLVFSARYMAAHSAFGLLALSMVCLSVTVVLTMYLLAAGQRWIGALLLVGSVVATVALAAAHGAPRSTAAADLAVQGGLALATAGMFGMAHARRSVAGIVRQVAT